MHVFADEQSCCAPTLNNCRQSNVKTTSQTVDLTPALLSATSCDQLASVRVRSHFILKANLMGVGNKCKYREKTNVLTRKVRREEAM